MDTIIYKSTKFMHDWFLSSKDYKNLSRNIFKKISKFSFSKKVDINEISKRLETLLKKESFPNLFYTESLWICSQARKNQQNNQIQAIVLIFLDALEEKIEQFSALSFDIKNSEKKDILNSFRVVNNSIVAITVNNLKKHLPNAKPCIKHCLTKEEVLDVKKSLSDILLIHDDNDDDLDKLLAGNQLGTISHFNQYALFSKYEQSIYKIYDISQSDDQNNEIALACLKYILTENDIIPDSFGLLGLVDDLFAIDHTLSLINKKNEIQTLVNIHDRNFPSFKLPELVSREGVISTLDLEHIVKASYTKESDKKINRLMIVPDVGPLSTLSALGHSICDRLSIKEESQNLSSFLEGDFLLLGRYKTTFREKDVVVRYDRQSKEYPQLYYVFDREGQRQTVQKKHLLNAFLVSKSKKISRGKTIASFKNQANPEVEGWSKIYFKENISKLESKGPIYFFTTKYITEKFLKEKIYGNSIADILGVRYFNKKHKFSDNFSNKQLFPEPHLYVIADDDVGIELLNKRIDGLKHINPSLIIIDSEKFYKNSIFLTELNNVDVDKVIFIEVYKDWHIKNLLENNFSCITAKPSKDIKTISENFLPMHSPTAIYLERSGNFESEYKVTKKKALSKFISHLEEIRSHLVEDNMYLFYKLIHLKDSIRSQISDRSDQNLIDFKENIQKIINELSYLNEFNKIYLPLLNFLENQQIELANVNKIDELKDFINKNISKNNTIVVPGSQADGLRNFIKNCFDSKHVVIKVVDPKQLEDINAAVSENIIIPSFISKPAMQRLRNYKYGKNHIYFGTIEEKNLHDQYLKKEKRIFETNFTNSLEFAYFKKDKKEQIIALDISVDDLFKNIFNNTDISNFQEASNYDSVKAKMLALDNNEVLLIPENGKEYLISSNEVYLQTASMLNLEDQILINSEFSGEDLIKNLLSENEENYLEYKELNKKAKSWKTILKI